MEYFSHRESVITVVLKVLGKHHVVSHHFLKRILHDFGGTIPARGSGVQATEQGIAGGVAHRLGAMGISKENTFFKEAVHVWCLGLGMAESAFPIVQVVYRNE